MSTASDLKQLKSDVDDVFDEVYDDDGLEEELRVDILSTLDDICLLIEQALQLLS